MNGKPYQTASIMRLFMATVFIIGIFGASMAADPSSYPRTIVDDAGREVTIQMPVEKIIPLSCSAAKILYLLGADDKIIAVGDDVVKRTSYLPGVDDKQSVGNWHEFDYEMIGELAKVGGETVPNIIVLCTVNGMDPVREIAPALEGFSDIAVIGLDTYSTENVTQDLEKLGAVLEKEAEVQENIDWYEEKISQVKGAVEGTSKPKVYNEMSASTGVSDLNSYGSSSNFNDLLEMANGYNVLREPKTYAKVSWEWVITQNPDVILKTGSVDTLGWEESPSQDATGLEATRNEILSRPGSEDISAVKNDRIYIVWNSMLSGFDNVVGVAYLAKVLHPEIDLDPEEICQEYLSRLGLDYQEGRIFVYPPMDTGSE